MKQIIEPAKEFEEMYPKLGKEFKCSSATNAGVNRGRMACA